MSNDYTLAIVDMQYAFTASRSNTVIRNCQREIIKAKKNKNPIILVEYSSQGNTIPSLVKLIKGYKRTWIAVKSGTDGSREVSNIINHYNLPRNVRVCGVNTDACVQDTVEGLSKSYIISKVDVVRDACNSCVLHGNVYGIENMRSFKLVSII